MSLMEKEAGVWGQIMSCFSLAGFEVLLGHLCGNIELEQQIQETGRGSEPWMWVATEGRMWTRKEDRIFKQKEKEDIIIPNQRLIYIFCHFVDKEIIWLLALSTQP